MQEHAVTLQTRKRNVAKLSGHTRDRRGCTTCRQRKKKCPGPEGRCDGCRRLNLHCEWEPARYVIAAAATDSAPHVECAVATAGQVVPLLKAPDPLEFWVQSNNNEKSPEVWNRRLSLRYYVQSFAAILSCNVENNGFLSVLLPMAMESPPLLDTMVACSSSHLALCRTDLKVKALEHRSSALTSFVSSFTTGKLSQEFALAVCLILCSMESILGDTSIWFEHLAGAASIIRSTLRRSTGGRTTSLLQQTVEGRWLLRNFAYHDILASVSLNSELLISGRYWMNEEDSALDTYFGIASQPVAMLAEITTLRTQMSRAEDHLEECDDSLEGHDFNAKAAQLETDLLEWQPMGEHDYALVCLAQSYRSAALIYLYRTLRFHRRRPAGGLAEDISVQVDSAIKYAEEMPVASLPECTLLFPLFVAGAETSEASKMQRVRGRLNDMLTYRRFENVRIALDVLEEVWDVRNRTHPVDSTRPYDWLDVLQRRGWKLALS